MCAGAPPTHARAPGARQGIGIPIVALWQGDGGGEGGAHPEEEDETCEAIPHHQSHDLYTIDKGREGGRGIDVNHGDEVPFVLPEGRGGFD